MADIEERKAEKELQELSVIGPDGVDGFGHHHYKLGEFIVIYYHGEIDWEYCLEEPNGRLSVIVGSAWIEDCNVLRMSAWKIRDFAEERTLDEYNKRRDSFPAWGKTDYFVKMDDRGGTCLIDCKTLEPAPDEVAERIMPKLGFSRTKV